MSKKCPFCGATLEDDDLFCDECGKKQKAENREETAPEQSAPVDVDCEIEAQEATSAPTSPEQNREQEVAEAQRAQLASMRSEVYNRMRELSQWHTRVRMYFNSPTICLHCGKKHLLEVKTCKECGAVFEKGTDNTGVMYRSYRLPGKNTGCHLIQDNQFDYFVADAEGGLKMRRFKINEKDHKKVDYIEFYMKDNKRVSDMLCLQSIDILNYEYDGLFLVLPPNNTGLTKVLSPDGKAAFWYQINNQPTGAIQTVFPGGTFKLEGGIEAVIKDN